MLYSVKTSTMPQGNVAELGIRGMGLKIEKGCV
jgi:hypothetical protein